MGRRRDDQHTGRLIEGHLPPQDLEAERALLGSCMLAINAMDEVVEVVDQSDLYNHGNQIIWSHLRKFWEDGKPVDVILLYDSLKKSGDVEEIGGEDYLVTVMESVPNAYHAKYYAELVRARSIERQIVYLCNEANARIFNHDATDSAQKVLEDTEAGLMAIQEKQTAGQAETLHEVLISAVADLDKRTSGDVNQAGGLSTGFIDIDRLIAGLRPSEFIVLAARPSMGKTALALNFALRAAAENHPILIFSLEQSKNELAERLLCMQSRVNGHRLRTGELQEADTDALMRAASEMDQYPIWIDPTATRTVTQMMAVARRIKRRKGLELIVIDYLQLIEPDDVRVPREQQVARISKKIKVLAKDLDVPVLALAQLNRSVEMRPDKTPKLSDLRESGSVEQDADVIMFLNRPEAWDPTDRPGEADVVVAKNRGGPTGTCALAWLSQMMRFEDLAKVPNSLPYDDDQSSYQKAISDAGF